MAKEKKRKSLPSALPTGLPPGIEADIPTFGPFNPTAAGWGNSSDPRDSVPTAGLKTLDNLAKTDFAGWSAIDVILQSMASNVKGVTQEEAKRRALVARHALIGTTLGNEIDDEEILLDIGRAYLQDSLQAEPGKTKSLHKLIHGVLATRRLGATLLDTHYRRLKSKFVAEKDRFVAAAVGHSHPEQIKRWKKVQKVIRHLADLGIAPKQKHRATLQESLEKQAKKKEDPWG